MKVPVMDKGEPKVKEGEHYCQFCPKLSRNKNRRFCRYCFGYYAAGKSIRDHRAYCKDYWTRAALARVDNQARKLAAFFDVSV